MTKKQNIEFLNDLCDECGKRIDSYFMFYNQRDGKYVYIRENMEKIMDYLRKNVTMYSRDIISRAACCQGILDETETIIDDICKTCILTDEEGKYSEY